jgi:hypothetical protein
MGVVKGVATGPDAVGTCVAVGMGVAVRMVGSRLGIAEGV